MPNTKAPKTGQADSLHLQGLLSNSTLRSDSADSLRLQGLPIATGNDITRDLTSRLRQAHITGAQDGKGTVLVKFEERSISRRDDAMMQ